ncbi:MAG: hypothetical protein KDA52_05195 [Planctomycetaceae bacterium]|nr:hypothetical protein [Planctomycetaceae bacterium]
MHPVIEQIAATPPLAPEIREQLGNLADELPTVDGVLAGWLNTAKAMMK